MKLESAAAVTRQPAVRERVEAAAGQLDQALRLIRDTVFGLEQRLRNRGLREEILELCGSLSRRRRSASPARSTAPYHRESGPG
jgi:hypothetical protein